MSTHTPRKQPDGKRATDEEIEAALAETTVSPEFCSWYDDAYGRVVFRIETHIGHYAERWIDPFHNHDGIVNVIEGTSRDLEAKHRDA